MFGLFNKKKKQNNINDDLNITTIITKTPSQAQDEENRQKQIDLKIYTCPICGYIDKYNQKTIAQNYEYTNIYVVSSKCEKCNAEWDTKYKEKW